jgi:hypothetical protein
MMSAIQSRFVRKSSGNTGEFRERRASEEIDGADEEIIENDD